MSALSVIMMVMLSTLGSPPTKRRTPPTNGAGDASEEREARFAEIVSAVQGAAEALVEFCGHLGKDDWDEFEYCYGCAERLFDIAKAMKEGE